MADLRGGGAERMMVNLASGLIQQNIEVDLLLARAYGPYLADVPESVQLRELSPTGGVLRALPSLIRYLNEEQPQLLLTTLHHASVIALLACKLSRARTPVFIREANTPSKRSSSLLKTKDWASDELVRLLYHGADGIIAVSEGVAGDLRKHFRLPANKVTVLYNPVVTDDLYDLARVEPQHPWFEQGQPPVILAVGRLHVQKDFPTLIRAFARIREERELKLVILGEGELRPDLEELVERLGLEGDVDLPGFVENPFGFMYRSALFVLSSKWEGLPGALIQAMACGCPIVATDCPSGPAEVLDDGRYGALVPVGDDFEMAAAMRRALDDPRNSEQLQARSRRYSQEAIVRDYVDYFERQLGN